MRILGQKLFPWQCGILLLISLQYGMCAVTLTVDPLTCGEPGIIRCLVQPFELIRWERNGNLINTCPTSGTCFSPDSGSLSFTANITEETYLITINPLEYGMYNGNSFTCADSNGVANITLNISVPLTGISLAQSQSGVNHVVTASSNCVKTSTTVSYTWSCVAASDNTTVITEHCNVTNVTSSVSSTSCVSGSDCSGSGLEVKNEILTLTNYTGSDIQLVRLSVNSSSFTQLTSETYQIKKTVSPDPDPGPEGCQFIPCGIIILIILVIVVLVVLVIIYCYWKKKCCCKNDNEKPDPIPPVSAADVQNPMLSGSLGHNGNKVQPATKGADGHNENIALQETPRVKAQQLPPIDPNHKAPDNISNVSVTQVSPHMEGNPQTNDEATNLRKKKRRNKDNETNTRGLSANVDTNNVWENEPPPYRKLPKTPVVSQQILEENKTSEFRITASDDNQNAPTSGRELPQPPQGQQTQTT